MKNMKKLFAMLLTLCMVIGTMTTAFAADTTVTLTINKTETGHKYEVYQMLVGDVSGLQDGGATLSNIEAGVNLSYNKTEGLDADQEKAEAKEAAEAFASSVEGKADTELASIASKKISGGAFKSLDGNGSSVGVAVAPGYYVVKDIYTDSNKECAAYMVAVVGDTTMEPKTSIPTIDKNIVDTDENKALVNSNGKKDTAAIGDVIKYEVTGNVPVTEGYKYYYYIVNDTLSTGLTLNSTFVVKINNVALTEGDDYAIYYPSESDHSSFRLTIFDMKQFDAGADIVIEYSATVNNDAVIGTENGNTNTVYLQYSNNPSSTFDKEKPDEPDKPGIPEEPGEEPGEQLGETLPVTTETYVTELTLQKTDADTKEFADALKGATFTLTGTGLNDVKVITETVFVEASADETPVYYKLKDGTYTKDAPVLDGAGATIKDYEDNVAKYVTKTVVSLTNGESGSNLNITAVVDANGQIKFTGLNAGTYKLTESNVPAGYNKAADIEFTITAGLTNDNKVTLTSTNTKVEGANGVFSVTVENKKGTLLPSTGGMGTTIFYVLGGLLVVGAGVLLITKKRVSNQI